MTQIANNPSDTAVPASDLALVTNTGDEPVSKRLLAKTIIDQLPKMSEAVSASVVADRDYKRQMVEDQRANHRNLNRMMTLMGALTISLIVTWVLSHPGTVVSSHICKTWGPYSFAITIAFDSCFTIYALFRRY